ncbi:conserved hypothetical protein [Parafrankia sp. Ea1.12]|uniref:YqjF family protein n=1 Tax=Parafrankia sp. Ea1.12 TaxID=573499 RepID=UPI000DA50580|nr:DUF2071 domain-containing protein [Parafrankia sp. Ea1.12]SQD95366.1 conserved hypothetical protein [Parafrankia sp. Ea1.12]
MCPDHPGLPDGRDWSDRPVVEPSCPFTVDRPTMTQRWERLTFVHWPVDPEAVGRLLPPELAADTYDDRAWVSLVPFYMRVATPGGRAVPWASHFCETNVRTYVVDRRGRRGIWFFSLEAARLGAVLVARNGFRLPYLWASMTLTETGGPSGGPSEIRYECRRRWPGPRGTSSRVRIRLGPRYQPGELGPLDHFLTARWIVFSSTGSSHRAVRAHHEPWPLWRAHPEEIDDGLVRATGLLPLPGEPLAHYSPGVDVRIGRPER